MASPATSREQRLRKTKAQLIDEIEMLEQHATAIEAGHGSGTPEWVKSSGRYPADPELLLLARFSSENPNPMLRVRPDATVLYANDAAIAVKGLLKGRKQSTLAHSLTKVLAEVSRTAEVQEAEFESSDRLLAFSIVPVTGATYINIYGRDITERKRAEVKLSDQNRFIELLHRISEASNEAATIDDAFKACLDEICANTGWPVGHVYVHNPEQDVPLEPSKVWHLANPRKFAAFRKITEATGFRSGEGLPGRVLKSKKAAWIRDVTEDKNFPRAKLAKNIGVRAGLAFPIMLGNQVLAVFEFFGEQAEDPDQRTLDILANVGRQLGGVIARKRAEDELAAKEAQLRVALDNMPGGMTLCDQDWNYLFFNSQYIELHDFPGGLLKVGGPALDETRFQAERGDFGPGTPNDLIEEVGLPYRSSEPESYERTFPNGRTLHFNIAPTPDGGYVTIATDITERKRAERKIQESEETFRAVVDQLPAAIVLKDAEGRFTIANKIFSEWFSKDGEEVVGKTSHDLFPKDVADKLVAIDLQVMKSGTSIHEENEAPFADGVVHTTLLSKFPIVGPDGNAFAVGSVSTDITERKRAEEQLQAAHTRLGQFSEAVSEYLDPMLVDNLRDGSDVEPRVHFVTVFFADLVGSTRLSREMDEDSYGEMIQKFVGEMQRVIKAHRGYLEDISGDGIFGYIGNFDSRGSELDAAEAIVMALEMQLRLADLSNEFQSRYGLSEPLRMRIGISSGNALVGKTAGVRAIYTANGDIVNLGAKLEQRLRDLPDAGGILISEQTAALVEGHFALDRHIVTIEGQEMGAYMVNPAKSSTAVL